MTRQIPTKTAGAVVLVAAGLLGGAALAAGRQTAPPDQNKPGMPTIARMYILNRDADEAVPVKIQSPSDMVPVAITGEPTVTLAPTAAVATHAARQVWEYRQLTIAAGEDVAATLDTAGAEGWDAVSAIGASGGRTVVILKRPK